MNVYLVKYTHHWIGKPPEVLTWNVLGDSLDEALETWRVSGHLGGELKDKEPDSIACLGEAILPAQGEDNPFACIECGAPAPWTRGHNPGCHRGLGR